MAYFTRRVNVVEPSAAIVTLIEMLGLFKRRHWKSEVIPELVGAYDGLTVVLRNFPCRVDLSDGTRKCPYPDFGAGFIYELTERQLGEFEQLRQILATGAEKTAYVRLRDLVPIEVRISGRAATRRDQFYSDLADALIVAFESHRIKP